MPRKRNKTGAGPSSRPAKVGEVMRQELSEMFAQGVIKDPQLDAAMTTVTEVRMSPDLHHAKVYVSIFAQTEDVRNDVMKAIKKATGSFRREVGRRMRSLRYVPEIEFELDTSIEYGARIESILNEIRVDGSLEDTVPEEGNTEPATSFSESEPTQEG